MDTVGWIIGGLLALGAGGAIGFLAAKSKLASRLAASEAALQSEIAAQEEQKKLLTGQLAEQKAEYENRLARQKADADEQLKQQILIQQEAAQKQYEQLKAEHSEQKVILLRQLAEQKTDSEKLLQTQKLEAEKHLNLQKAEAEEKLQKQTAMQQEIAQKQYEQLKSEFTVLAEKILAEKSADFEKSGKTQLDAVITPLKVKLDEFKANAELARKQSDENNIKLAEQIQLLMKSSRELSEEANALARALRSDNKLQGNWGEMILDEILASSGLIENVHYQKQATLVDDDNNALRNEDTDQIMRPDVLVNYPDGKVVIIDRKALGKL